MRILQIFLIVIINSFIIGQNHYLNTITAKSLKLITYLDIDSILISDSEIIIKDKDIKPINVIRMIEINISRPGISYGK